MPANVGADRAHRLVMLAASMALTSACGELLGVDEYRLTPAGPGADALDAASVELPLLPAIPDEWRKRDCEACVRDQCDEEFRSVCLGEPRCRAMLACQGQCWDPACLVECTDRWPRSYAFEDYFACAFGTNPLAPIQSRCPEQCGAGHNWDCSGDYTWPLRSGRATVSVRVWRVGAPGQGPLTVPIGAQIASCSDLFVMSAPPGDHGCGARVPVSPYVDGAVDVVADDVFADAFVILGVADRSRIYPREISRSGPLVLGIFSLRPNDAFGNTLSVIEPIEHVDSALGFVVGALFDCLGSVAEAQASIDPTGSERRIGIPGGAVILAPEDFQMVSAFFNVQPGPAVRLRMQAPDGPEVTGKNMIVAPGWLTQADLFPPE